MASPHSETSLVYQTIQRWPSVDLETLRSTSCGLFFKASTTTPVSIQRPTSSERRNQFGCMSHLSNMVFVMGIAFPLAAEATQDACRNHRIGPNGCTLTQRPSEIPTESSVPLCCTKTASHWSIAKKSCPTLWKLEEEFGLIRVSENNILAYLTITAKSGVISGLRPILERLSKSSRRMMGNTTQLSSAVYGIHTRSTKSVRSGSFHGFGIC